MAKASHHVVSIISILILHLYYGGEALTGKWTVFFLLLFFKDISWSRFSLFFWNYRAFVTKDLFTMELDGKFYRMYQIENVEKCYIVTLIRKFWLLGILRLLIWLIWLLLRSFYYSIIWVYFYLASLLGASTELRPSVISSNSWAQI